MPRESETIISGERNLLDVDDLSSNMRRLRELFDLFEQRTALVRLLDLSHQPLAYACTLARNPALPPWMNAAWSLPPTKSKVRSWVRSV